MLNTDFIGNNGASASIILKMIRLVEMAEIDHAIIASYQSCAVIVALAASSNHAVSSISETAQNSVFTGQGIRTVTVTPVPSVSFRSALLNEFTYAFVAKYTAESGHGITHAVDPILRTFP